jgi:hypothetical protein
VPIPVRTFPWGGCGASLRPDDRSWGVPEVGDVTDDVRALAAPVVAELPHRVAHDLVERGTGVVLRSGGAQGLIDSTSQDLPQGEAERDRQEAVAGVDAWGVVGSAPDRRGEIAMDGGMAPLEGRWQEATGGPILVRRLEAQAEAPTLGALLARRDVGVLGSAEDLAVRLHQVIREAGWEPMPRGEIGGDGAQWMGTLANVHVPGVGQTRDDSHLREPF